MLVSPSRPNGSRREMIVVLLVLAVLGSALVLRVHYGIEWYGDEANALNIAGRYAAGDRPVVDSWESNFSSGMLVAPFVWVLDRLNPDRSGIVLDFRYLFVAMQLLYAFAVWRLARPLASRWWAVVIAVLVGLYLPYYYLFPYYNNICFALFTLSALHLLRGFALPGSPDTRYLIGAGVLSGFGVIAYPTMILALPFFAIGMLAEMKTRDGRPAAWAAIAKYAMAAGIVLGAFVLVTLVASGLRGIAEALPHFANPVDRNFALSAILGRFWRTKSVLITATAACLAGLVVASVRRGEAGRPVAAISATIVTSVVVAAGLYRLRVPWLSYLDMPQACALGIGLATPALALLRQGPPITGKVLRLLCLPALGVALATVPASLEGFETASMPSVMLMVGAVLVLGDAVAASRLQPQPAAGSSSATRYLAAGAAILAAMFFLYGSMQYVGGDAPTRLLDTAITEGPYSGIRTTRENVERYMRYERIFQPLALEPGRIAFIEEFPLGYVLTGRRPGTYSEWTTFATGDRWQDYLDLTGNYPTTIVSTTFIGPNGGVADAPFPPPFGLRDFEQKYREVRRNDEFVVYEMAQ